MHGKTLQECNKYANIPKELIAEKTMDQLCTCLKLTSLRLHCTLSYANATLLFMLPTNEQS